MSELARQINEASRLEGEFKLRSGQIATHYFDKYRFEARPDLLRKIAQRMVHMLPKETEVIAGLELGGVPIVTAMSLESGIQAVFVRKEAKTYGTCKAVEGGDVAGRKTVIIEDVISTGGAVSDAAELLMNEGADLIAVVCAIWRGKGEPAIQSLRGIPILPALTESELSSSN
jgi:orotate phosphoribosyltransferase